MRHPRTLALGIVAVALAAVVTAYLTGWQRGAVSAHAEYTRQAAAADATVWQLSQRLERARAVAQVESVEVTRWLDRWRTVRDTVVDTVAVPYPVYVELRTACDSLASSCARAQRAEAAFRIAVDSARAADRAIITQLRVALATCEGSRPSRATWAAVGSAVGVGAGVAACRAAGGGR